MRELLDVTFHFDKTASRRKVKGGRLDWEAAIHESLAETAPYVIDSGNQVEIEWDEKDPEAGYALGKVIVWNRPPLPPVMTSQKAMLQQQNVQDPGKAVTIPIHVRGFDLYDPTVFIDTEGHAHMLTEKRWMEQMGQPESMGAIDPNAGGLGFQTGSPTHGLPAEAAGYARTGQGNIGAKTASEGSLLQRALGTADAPDLDPYDQDRMGKVASDKTVLAGLGRTRALPIVRFILAAPSRSLSQYQVDAVDQQPRAIAFVQQTAQPPVGSRGLQFQTTLVGARYFDPVNHEGDFLSTVELLKGLVPDIAQRLQNGGDHVIWLQPGDDIDPFVIEDMVQSIGPITQRGCWLVMDAHHRLARADVVPDVKDWSGDMTGQRLFVTPDSWAMGSQGTAVGTMLAPFGVDLKVQAPGTPVKTAQWVSIVLGDPMSPDATWMAPCRVLDDMVCCGRRVMRLVSYAGEDIDVMFVPGVARVIAADGVKWPDVAGQGGAARYIVPASAAIVPLGGQTTLIDDANRVRSTIDSYIRARSGISFPSRGTVRFTAGAMSEEPYLTIVHHASEALMGNDWTLRGEILQGVLGDNVGEHLSAAQVRFVLACLGASSDDVDALLSRAQQRGQITIGGLRSVQRAVNTDGTAKAPYLRKLAEASIHIRSLVPDEPRDSLLKAAACVGIANLEGPVRELLADEQVIDRLDFLKSAIARAVRVAPEKVIEKVAAALADPESIDVMLGLNVVNERNVGMFLADLSLLLEVEDRLAELLLLARQGLKDVDPDDVEEALRALNTINEQLEYLETQMRQDRIRAKK